MAPQLTQLFETVDVAEPQQAGGLQVFGLRWGAGNGLVYLTLDEALATQALDVTEVSQQGSVPTLKVLNKTDTLVFLMAGEQLVGAKQNRVLNASIMVPGKTELAIPVSCVEAGRWGYRSAKFFSKGTMSHGLLRKMMTSHTTEGYRTRGTPTSKQGEVWSEVSRKLGAMKSESSSQALDQAYSDHQLRLSDVLGQLQAPRDCSGVAFVLDGAVGGVDLFDKPATLGKFFPKLVRAYALDALEKAKGSPEAATRLKVKAWLLRATRANEEPFKSPGLGYDIRLQGADLIGAGLVVDEHPIHVELFANESAEKVEGGD